MKTALIFLIFTIQANLLTACSCKYPTKIEDAFAYANTVAYGEIVQLKIIKVSDTMGKDSLIHYKQKELTGFQMEVLNSDFIVEAKLKVKELFKGNVLNDTLILYTTRTEGSCGFTRFLIGEDYLVYASANSYAFYKFYRPQNKRMLEKKNTKWVTSCSITAEFDDDHYAKLKEVKSSIQNIEIAEKSFSILKKNNLLKISNKTYASVFVKGSDKTYESLEFDDEEIITNIEISRQDLILRINSIDKNSVEVNFNSYDNGTEHVGTMKLKKEGDTWLKNKLNYVTEIK